MAAVCEKVRHFIKRFFKVFARLDFHPRIMNIVYHVYVHMCTFFHIERQFAIRMLSIEYSLEYFWKSRLSKLWETAIFIPSVSSEFFLRTFETLSLPYPIKREQFCKRGTSIALQLYYCGTILLSLWIYCCIAM